MVFLHRQTSLPADPPPERVFYIANRSRPPHLPPTPRFPQICTTFSGS